MNPFRFRIGLAGLAAALALLPLTAATVVPDFELPHAGDGKAFKSAEARGKIVALHFLLKTECPFCLKHTHTYLKRAAEVPGVVHVFIKPDTEEEIRSWSRDMPKDAPIYRDAGAALARRFEIPDGYQFHGQTVHFPALVILDAEGREVFRHVGKDNVDRFRFDDFAKKVAELRAAAKK
jgi:peroxiredoxin Q/BCP